MDALKLLALVFSVYYGHSLSSAAVAERECSTDHESVILQVSSSRGIPAPPGSGCSEVVNGSAGVWECGDLQSALEAIGVAAEVGRAIFGSVPTASLPAAPECAIVEVPEGVHYITAPVHLGNTSMHFRGRGRESSAVGCSYRLEVDEERVFDVDYEYPDYVLYFNRSQSVGFEGVAFTGCPYPFRLDTVGGVSVINSTFRLFREAVFDIYNSPDVTIADSSFIDNRGTGISRYPYRGNSGAVAIGYNNLSPQSAPPSALVTRCNFTNNSATAENQFRTTNNAFFSRIFSGRGGGLAVFFNESFHNATVEIMDNHFERNFARSFGGALFHVIFGSNTQQQFITQRNTFVSNTALLGGGGILLTFISNGIEGAPHAMNVSDSVFYNNTGQTGGAAFLYFAYEVFGVSFIKFERCRFVGNHGVNTREEYGAAVAMYLVNQFRNREAPRYEFIDCSFEENFGINGILSVGYAPVLFRGNTSFVRNNGTSSLTLIGSLVDFYDNVSFINNTAGEEGTLQLLSFGQFRLREGTQMLFEGNSGRFGASIVVDTPSATIAFDRNLFNPQCFVLYENPDTPPTQWNDVSVTFRRNSAILASSLYIARLGTCSWYTLGPPYFNQTILKWWPVWNYGNDSVNTGYSRPKDPTYQIETLPQTISTPLTAVRGWPGERIQIQLTGWDQFRTPTTANARFLFKPNTTTLGDTTVVVRIIPEVIVIEAGLATPTLEENFTLTYTVSIGDALTSNEPIGRVEIDAPFYSIEVRSDSFTLYPSLCPAGYTLFPTLRGLECQCKENVTEIILCEEDQDRIVIENGFWVTSSEQTAQFRHEISFYPCPPGYCGCSQNTSLGERVCAYTYRTSDPNGQCICDREGVLCGRCRAGLGVSALLNRCVTCSDSQAMLILVLILCDVIALVSVAVIDVPLPQWLYSFLFYIQVVPYVALFFPESFQHVGNPLYFISSGLSFYFVYDFCLYGNTSPLISYLLRYTPLIIALLLMPLVILFRKKRWRLLKHHGLWSIVLLLYSHVTYTSMTILDCPLLPPDNSPRWFVDGTIGCFTGGHAPLALLAIVVLAVCVAVIPLTALIATKIHRKSRRLYWLQFLVVPLTESFKREWRWWAAVELGRRFVFLLFFVSFPRNYASPLLMMCVMVTVYALVQPYKSQAANILEVMVQINFILLLLLPSTQLIKETLFSFTPPGNVSLPARSPHENGTCTNGPPSITPLTWLLFPFYYLPLLGVVVVAAVYLGLFLGKKMKTASEKKQSEEQDGNGFDPDLDSSMYVTRYHPSVTTTELRLEETTELSLEKTMTTRPEDESTEM